LFYSQAASPASSQVATTWAPDLDQDSLAPQWSVPDCMGSEHAVHLRHKHQHRIDMEAAMQPLLQDKDLDDTAGCVALVAGDGSAASLQYARSVASQQHWDAVYSMLADVPVQHISPQACRKSSQTTHRCACFASHLRHVEHMISADRGANALLQAVRISADDRDPAAAPAGRSDITHIHFAADAASSGQQLAAGHETFRRVVEAARAAGAQLQQAHFSLVQPGRLLCSVIH
jgi:hypothetical protein